MMNRIDRSLNRMYLDSVMQINAEILDRYPHLCFKKHWEITPAVWYALGQCEAMITAIRETPLQPANRRRLLRLSLTRGAQATTAIEGNTLSEAEIEKVIQGGSIAPSRAYQAREVENIVEAMNNLLRDVAVDDRVELISPALIKSLHSAIGKGLGEHFDAIPGHLRQDERTVGPYRCPRHQDVPALVEYLCDWLQREFGFRSDNQSFCDAVVQAIVTHVYLEWIHPFGDGNGRVGRLVEFYILLRAGNPDIASHILSNHYNLTRDHYYRQLQEARNSRDLTGFIGYAVQGYRDGLADSLREIQRSHFEIAWRTFVYDRFADLPYRKKTVFKRRRALILNMPIRSYFNMDELLLNLPPKVRREYRNLSLATLRRDLKCLQNMELVVERDHRFTPNADLLRHQMPTRRHS